MNIDPSRLSTVLRDIYSATLEPADRALLPHRAASAFDGTSCLIHTRDRGPAGVTIVGGTDNCAAFLPAYVEYYHARDAWTERALARRPDEAFLGEELVPLDELLAAEWYNDLLKRHEIHHLVGAAFNIEPGAMGAIGIHRPADAPEFENHDRDLLNLLLPHLRQALRLIRRLDESERMRRLSLDSLAALSVAVFVVASGNRVRLMNAAAERAVRANKTIRVQNSRISLANPNLDQQLRSAIAKAALASIGRSVSAGQTIMLRSGDSPLLSLLVSPLPPEVDPVGPTEPLAAVFVSEPGPDPEPSHNIVRATYGLTPAEARVLSAIVRGRRLADYAVAAGVSSNTVHAQIKAVYAKTGCHSQADLVRKILSDPLLRLSRAFADRAA